MKERIIQLREALKMSQADFGKKIGLARSGISSVENGQRVVQERHIKLILSAFPDVSEDWLRNGIGKMFKSSSSEAERLVKKYSFPDIVGKLLKVYEGLNNNQQEAVLEYAQRIRFDNSRGPVALFVGGQYIGTVKNSKIEDMISDWLRREQPIFAVVSRVDDDEYTAAFDLYLYRNEQRRKGGKG